MRIDRDRKASRLTSAIAAAVLLSLSAISVSAADVPEFMKICDTMTGPPVSKEQIAADNVISLNDNMFPIYESSLGKFKQNFRARNNLIMALFSAKGGRFILYRAGQPPLESESPPIVYRFAKSVGHTAMATYELVAPYCANGAADLSWKSEMLAYRTRVQSALDSLDAVDAKPEEKALLRETLNQVMTFMNSCLAKDNFTYDEVQAYCRGVEPNLAKLIAVASGTQVAHWYKVLEQWKQLLGKDWDNTYGLSNSIYVARQNNILFSVMVQFMGEKAINDRLLLLETTDFTASPDDMLTSFMRIISDRALGEIFYKNYRLMDYELLGGGGRKAIENEATKRGLKPLLPPLVPYNSNAWPWKTDPGTGTGPSLLEQVH